QWIQRGGQVAKIINIDTVFVRSGIQEKYISKVRVGDPARVTVDAYPGRIFEGRVRHIIPQADVASRTFPVKIEVANPGYLLKGGMFARVVLFYGPKHPALMVPKDALSRLGRRSRVFVAKDGRAHAVSVKTGRTFGGLVEIVEGDLSKGDRVIVTGNESLRDRRPTIVRAIRTPDGKLIPVKAPAGKGPSGRWSGKRGGWGPGKGGAPSGRPAGKPGGPWPKDDRRKGPAPSADAEAKRPGAPPSSSN
ncbi:MAG: efflux RND transporter periplasmic adaptor subunit, partial [Nitrospinota bacterium]